MGHATGGIPIESEFSKDGVYKVISIGSYSTDNTYHDQGIRAIKSEKTKSRLLNKNDLTMILNDKTTIEKNIIGRTLLIEESGVYVYNQRTERIELDITQFDPSFIYEELNAPHIRQKIIAQSQGNTQVYVNWSSISQLVYSIPSLSEQQKIGSFFRKLDDLLALHQRQTQKLTELKQGLLQNMFPREGESVPRLRFPGFTTNWKQQKLGDIYNFHYGEFNNNPDNNGPYPVYGANGIIGGYTKFNAEDSSIIGHIGAAGYVKWGMGKHFVTYNGTIAKPAASSLDSKFGYYALSNKKIYKICAGSGRPFVSYADLNSIDMRIPNDLLEQKKISLLFTRLDDLLALHEQYIVKLTQLKKGLLQKMFPQD